MIFFLFLQPQKEKTMAKVCQITGKKTVSGNNVSHANNKTKRKFYPNLQNKRLYLEEEGIWVSLRVSTHALRIINKLGLSQALRKSGLEIIRL
jgi:large subunit ribosomal protein L28